MTIVFRSVKGSNVTPDEVDGNFGDLNDRVTALEDTPIDPITISSIALAGTAFTMGLSDGSTLGPITFTIPMPSWRGAWTATTAYTQLNFFTAPSGELGAVLRNHTSASSFDWAAVDGSSNPVYQNISGSATGALAGLSDVVLTSPAPTEVLGFNGTNWVNTPASPGVSLMSDLSDTGIASPTDGAILQWDDFGGAWTNRDFGNVSVGSLSAFDILYWNTGTTSWVNGSAGDFVTPHLAPFQLDLSGSPGVQGVLPASASGDAAARKIFDAAGSWVADHDIVTIPFVAGAMANNQDLFFFRVPRPCYIPANFAAQQGYQSRFGGTANATGSPAITMSKAASATPNTFSSVGTITIGTGTVSPSALSTSSAIVHFAAGDVIRLRGPATADGTFAGFYGSLVLFGE